VRICGLLPPAVGPCVRAHAKRLDHLAVTWLMEGVSVDSAPLEMPPNWQDPPVIWQFSQEHSSHDSIPGLPDRHGANFLPP
jgi:hypothetical protein